MNIRNAILMAADHIERTGLWNWRNLRVPDCGTPACALGWIAHFMGCTVGESFWPVFDSLGVDGITFYDRMRGIDWDWRDDNDTVRIAAALRAYADKYHQAESCALIPASVRAIFLMTPEQIRAEFQKDAA